MAFNKFGEFASVTGPETPMPEMPDGPDAVDPVGPGTALGGGGGTSSSGYGPFSAGDYGDSNGLSPMMKYTAALPGYSQGGGVLPVDDEDPELDEEGEEEMVPQQAGGMPQPIEDLLGTVRGIFDKTRAQFGIGGEQQFLNGGDVTNPATSHKVPEPGGPIDFEEGGPVPDEMEQPEQPSGLLPYGAGAGALPPEVAKAIEQRVDPQGSMDPNERVVRALAMAGEQGPGLLQHYRQKYNALQAFAKAALTGTQQKPGDPMASARAATQMMQYVPDGKAYDFHPTPRGMAMRTRSVGQPSVQQFAEGGAVEDDEEEYANARTGQFTALEPHPDEGAYFGKGGKKVLTSDPEADTEGQRHERPFLGTNVAGVEGDDALAGGGADALAGSFKALEKHPDERRFARGRGVLTSTPEPGQEPTPGQKVSILPWDQYKKFLGRLYDWWSDELAASDRRMEARGMKPAPAQAAAAKPMDYSDPNAMPQPSPGMPRQKAGPVPVGQPGQDFGADNAWGVPETPAPYRQEEAPKRNPQPKRVRFVRTDYGWSRVPDDVQASIPEDISLRGEALYPQGRETERAKWMGDQLAAREKYASAERIAETRGTAQTESAEARASGQRDSGEARAGGQKYAADKRWGAGGGEETKAKIRAGADVDRAKIGAGAKNRATDAKFTTEYARIIAKMQGDEAAQLTKIVNQVAQTPAADGKMPSEDMIKQAVMRRADALKAAAKLGVPLDKAFDALAQFAKQGDTEEAPAASGSIPTFSTPAEVQAAIKSGQLKKGSKFRTADGRVKQVP